MTSTDNHLYVDPHMRVFRLDYLIAGFALDARSWDILDDRINRGLSLSGSGLAIGITRERVRQLQDNATKAILSGSHKLVPAIETLEASAKFLWTPFAPESTFDAAAVVCQSIFAGAGWQKPSVEDVRRLLTAIRVVREKGVSGLPEAYSNIVFATCALPLVIVKHPEVAKQVRLREQEARRWSYEELAEAILEEANQPLHWKDIVSRAEKLAHRKQIYPAVLRNMLIAKQDKFARVNQGTYGLVAWGLTTVDPYPDIMAHALKAVGHPLAYGELFQRVNHIRPITEESFRMYADLHPRFYHSEENSYGLRAWLPSREKQTLRTPAWQAESAKSYQRVGKAAEHGYDVDNIIAGDKQ